MVYHCKICLKTLNIESRKKDFNCVDGKFGIKFNIASEIVQLSFLIPSTSTFVCYECKKLLKKRNECRKTIEAIDDKIFRLSHGVDFPLDTENETNIGVSDDDEHENTAAATNRDSSNPTESLLVIHKVGNNKVRIGERESNDSPQMNLENEHNYSISSPKPSPKPSNSQKQQVHISAVSVSKILAATRQQVLSITGESNKIEKPNRKPVSSTKPLILEAAKQQCSGESTSMWKSNRKPVISSDNSNPAATKQQGPEEQTNNGKSKRKQLFSSNASTQTIQSVFKVNNMNVQNNKDVLVLSPEEPNSTSAYISVRWPSTTRHKCLPKDTTAIGIALLKGVPFDIAKRIWSHKNIKKHLKEFYIKDVLKEVEVYCSEKTETVLRKSSPEDILAFTFETLDKELQEFCPSFRSILKAVAMRKNYEDVPWMSTICIAASLCLKVRQPKMYALQKMLDMLEDGEKETMPKCLLKHRYIFLPSSFD